MRIVSWVVVAGSLAALFWLGVSPLFPRFEWPDVDRGESVGSVVAPAPREDTATTSAGEPPVEECKPAAQGATGEPGDEAMPKPAEGEEGNPGHPACEQR